MYRSTREGMLKHSSFLDVANSELWHFCYPGKERNVRGRGNGILPITSRLPSRRAAMNAIQSQQSIGKRHDQKSG